MRYFGLASALVILATLGCRIHREESEVLHNDSEPVRNPGSWQWLDISEKDYLDVVATYLSLPPPEAFVLPERDQSKPEQVLVARMQFWLDAIDASLRERSPEALKFVPKPKAVIVSDAEANAFVSPVPVCLDVPMRLNPELPVTPKSTLPYISYQTDGFLAPERQASPPCVRRNLSKELLVQIVAWFNSNHASCDLKVENDRTTGKMTFFAGKNCPMDPELETVSLAEQTILTTTTNWVTINTGLIAQFPTEEWMIVPTLAHELGHYYRSHMTTFEQEYNFFYRLGAANWVHRPVADPQLKLRGQAIVQSAHLLQLNALANQNLMPSLFEAAASTVRRFCRRSPSSCTHTCKKLDDLMTSGKLADAVGSYPDDELSSGGIAVYQKFEALFSQCSNLIKIGNPEPSGGLTPQAVVAELRHAGFDLLFDPLPAGNTLKKVFAGLKAREASINSAAKQRLEKAEKDRLARYTVEQEADEFGLEQFVMLGFEPKSWIEADFVFNRTEEDDQTCEQLYRRGWKDEAGLAVLPDRGGFYETHPNDCFRTFNIDQEIAAHRYEKLAISAPAPGEPTWPEVVAMAKSLSPVGTSESTAGSPHTGNFPHFKKK